MDIKVHSMNNIKSVEKKPGIIIIGTGSTYNHHYTTEPINLDNKKWEEYYYGDWYAAIDGGRQETSETANKISSLKEENLNIGEEYIKTVYNNPNNFIISSDNIQIIKKENEIVVGRILNEEREIDHDVLDGINNTYLSSYTVVRYKLT